MRDRAVEAPGSLALETPFESLINWIITQAIEFPSGQIRPSLPNGLPSWSVRWARGMGVELEVRWGSAFLKCPHALTLTPAFLHSFWGGNPVMKPKGNRGVGHIH